MNPNQSQSDYISSAIETEYIQSLKEELEHFVHLSQAQAEQLKHYARLQQQSHQLIESLKRQLESHDSHPKITFKRAASQNN